ncbi:MAG: glycosyltransferase family 2 protein [Candidatus Omnitrophica bacterium]|nr:glycosyltransferase family 2 protein [Candidatus Omnitrophota bacterium]
MKNLPSVTVIIPCLNEKDFIGNCLDSVIANDYPKDVLEVLVIDGISKDGTREILQEYAEKYPFVSMLENHKSITPAALNVGVRHAKGEIIVRMDAHSTYEGSYISKCVRYLDEYKADNVGGIWVTVARNGSLIAKAITISLSHTFGVGNAYYRVGRPKEPMWVDTVPFGCYRKDIFNKVGFFDETVPRNEDIEFNARLRKSGGKILLVPDIAINYYARTDLKQFIRHNFDNGLKVTYPFNLHRMIFSWRHLIPFIFVVSLFVSLGVWWLSCPFGVTCLMGLSMFLSIVGVYLLVNSYFSVKVAIREKDLKILFLVPVVFALLHLSYGTGSVCGLLKCLFRRRNDSQVV